MWLGIAIAVGLIVWAVGGLIALNPLPWHIRKYWDVPGEKELRIIQAIALLLIVAGVTIFFTTESGTFWHDLWTEMVATGGAVLGIDELNRRRNVQTYKQSIIRQMASRSNDFALDAARIARDEGWLKDGSLRYTNFQYANLQDAYLEGADLQRTVFFGANLQNARLMGTRLNGALIQYAQLQGAVLLGADLRNAYLMGTNVEGANLAGSHFEGAIYNSTTRWPEGFDPKQQGAINRDELTKKE